MEVSAIDFDQLSQTIVIGLFVISFALGYIGGNQR